MKLSSVFHIYSWGYRLILAFLCLLALFAACVEDGPSVTPEKKLAKIIFDIDENVDSITIRYKDGIEESFALGIPINLQYGKTVKSVRLGSGPEFLIGRKTDRNINLKFRNGALVLRNADDGGYIPIGSYAEFQLINESANLSGKKYKQEADIDLMEINWIPIGDCDNEKKFAGIFDGDGYRIDNLKISLLDTYLAGLFGEVDNGTLRNVRVHGGQVRAESVAGGVVGRLDGGSITACFSSASVTAGNDGVGGVVGRLDGGSITACSSSSVVNGGTRTGGVVGYIHYYSEVTACYSTGVVSGDKVGGVAGVMYEDGNIIACYSTAALSGNKKGGVVGAMAADDYDNIVIACYWDSSAASAQYGIGATSSSGDRHDKPGNDTGAVSFSSAQNFPDLSGHDQWGTSDGAFWKAGTTGGGQLPKLYWED